MSVLRGRPGKGRPPVTVAGGPPSHAGRRLQAAGAAGPLETPGRGGAELPCRLFRGAGVARTPAGKDRSARSRRS